jgi:hypothetical protein
MDHQQIILFTNLIKYALKDINNNYITKAEINIFIPLFKNIIDKIILNLNLKPDNKINIYNIKNVIKSMFNKEIYDNIKINFKNLDTQRYTFTMYRIKLMEQYLKLNTDKQLQSNISIILYNILLVIMKNILNHVINKKEEMNHNMISQIHIEKALRNNQNFKKFLQPSLFNINNKIFKNDIDINFI